MTLLEQAQHKRLVAEHEAARRKYGVAFYRPHPKQDLFHRMGDYRFRYMRTGNRFGKSDMGAAEDVAFLLGERPWYSKDDPARYAGLFQRSTKGLLICTDWQKAEEIFTNETEGKAQGKLFRFIPKDSFVKRYTNHGGEIYMIEVESIHGDISTLYIDTVAAFKQNPQKAESSWWDFIHVDEPIPQAMWTASSRGLMDSDGKAWFTCTPICEPWINKKFVPNRRTVLDPNGINVFPQTPDHCLMIGSSRDNPYISESGINSYFQHMDEAEKNARLMGVPLESSGVIYYMFGEDHIFDQAPEGWENINTPPLDYTIRYAIDPHPKTPHAVLFVATSPEGRVYFYDEIFDPCDSKELCEQIKEKTKHHFVATALVDPSGGITSMTDKSSLIDDFAQEGIYLEKSTKDLQRGLIAVKQALNKPGFLNFSHELSRTIFEFDAYAWDNPITRPNKPRDQDDHMMENLYRLVLTGLDYFPQDDVEESKAKGSPAFYSPI